MASEDSIFASTSDAVSGEFVAIAPSVNELPLRPNPSLNMSKPSVKASATPLSSTSQELGELALTAKPLIANAEKVSRIIFLILYMHSLFTIIA